MRGEDEDAMHTRNGIMFVQCLCKGRPKLKATKADWTWTWTKKSARHKGQRGEKRRKSIGGKG